MPEELFLLNNLGTFISFCDVGASIKDIIITMKSGDKRTITLHPMNESAFASSLGYYGKTIGRNAGRIENGKFTLEGREYRIKEQKASHGLHGGDESFAFQKFAFAKRETQEHSSIVFTHFSRDGEGGFPGKAIISVTYSLARLYNRLEISYAGKCSQNTLLNMTNHTYFNLDGNGLILDHSLTINASSFAEIDSRLLPKKVLPVDKTMDFRESKLIKKNIEDDHMQKISKGYDHPYILDNSSLDKPSAILVSSDKDLTLNIYTTYPVLVFYSGNYPTSEEMNFVSHMVKYQALALEPQYLPNAINESLGQTKTGLLTAGSSYQETIIYEFVTK